MPPSQEGRSALMLVGMALLVSAALAIYVVTPLLLTAGSGEGILPIDVTPLTDLKRRRVVVYENIKDLDFEYQSGKIARDDYQTLRESYLAEAAELMIASQEAERVSEQDSLIELEVAARRARRKPEPAREYVCPKCGFENPLPVKFCGECGARIAPRK